MALGRSAEPACPGPLVTLCFWVVVPAASTPVIQHVTERSELVHDAPITTVVLVFALDVGQTVQLRGTEAKAVLDELRFAERFELFLGG